MKRKEKRARSHGPRKRKGRGLPLQRKKNDKSKRRKARARTTFAGLFGLKTDYVFSRKESTELLKRVAALRRRVGAEG